MKLTNRFSSSKKSSAFLVLALCGVSVVDSFMAPQRVALPMRTQALQSASESNSEGATETPDITGKDIYQRAFYRLSSSSDVASHDNIIVEERVRFLADDTKGEGYLKPVGPRTLILRDGKVEEGDIGDEIFSINVKESMAEGATHGGAGRDSAMEATIAAILYVASNPIYMEGSVLEIGSGLGLAGLLGCIGAGALGLTETGSDPAGAKKEASDDILTIPKATALTNELKQLTLSDADQESLNLAIANIKASNVPMSRVSVEELAWRTRSLARNSPKKVFHTILASDLNYNFPEAKELAHTVAHRLQAVSSWEAMKGDSISPPTFVHVCPDAREDTSYLQKFLTKGYRMNVKTGYIKMEKLLFAYQMLPKSDPEEKLDDLELAVQEDKDCYYQSLTAQHDPAYADGAGEYFFPMETGEYDSASGQTYLEPESDGSKWY